MPTALRLCLLYGLSILAVGASLVQVANPDPSALQRRIETEKVTRVL